MKNTEQRITFNPKQCGGRPCIRGMRIRVIDVLDLLATGLSFDQILDEMPDLERDDISAAISYEKETIDHSVIANRAEQSSRDEFLASLAAVPAEEPIEGDKIPDS